MGSQGPDDPGHSFFYGSQGLNRRGSSSASAPVASTVRGLTLSFSPTMSGDEGEFTLENWAKESQLSKKTVTTLRKEECDKLQALKLFTSRDINRMNITVGQARLLRLALQGLGNPISLVDDAKPGEGGKQGQPGAQVQGNNGELLDQAGDELAELLAVEGDQEEVFPDEGAAARPLGGNQPGGGGTGGGLCDPLMLLTVRATTRKALQILNFLPESVRARVNRRRRDQLTLATGADGAVTVKAEEMGSYYVTLDEWSGANMRLGAQLYKSGDIAADKLVYYMAYTALVADLAARYEWGSVLEFDMRYRELQAEHGFDWGTQHPHMEMYVLIPKRSYPQPGKGKGNGNSYKKEKREKVDLPCRQYLVTSHCKFGDACIYRHDNQVTGGGMKKEPKNETNTQ